ncbi:MAG TPA: bifunctional glutamate N-acetyltransferase/amino-acid acetyltransferase ArgJ [Acidobacteriaceae bacterium]|jgi:glutamate N-acetyltransferase/amino-acid N-acetyltransferase|nr:bifunctional glutamate N-acetyltransferase/amino-acid acetyltransferase ArgJ [Acidobacteriaceae bacterium]
MDALSQLTDHPLLAEEAVPRGFRFAAVRAGIKASGNPDLACAVSERPATAAAMFTSNRVVAAPVVLGREHLAQSRHQIRALVVNAGNANCATGQAGMEAAQRVCREAAEVFGCDPHAVFPSSTGIIGVPLPEQKLISALPAAREALGSSAAHLESMARAIMTTDTRPKVATAVCTVDGATVRLAGIAKGAGMIFPRLASPHATMLAYIFTDGGIAPETAAALLAQSVESSFNRISIDGDTSTNDTVLLWASGASGATIPDRDNHGSDFTAFAQALDQVCLSLAKQIVADGEGIKHVVELNIVGAATDADALRVARAIAHSPLVKTSWAGCDPNWGRILSTVGSSGVPIDPALVNISLGDLEICDRGGVSPRFDKGAAHRYLQQHDISIRVDLGAGSRSCRFWTTDLTAEYVRINADYST